MALAGAAVLGAVSLAMPWWSGQRFGASELSGFDLARIALTGGGLARGGLDVALRVAGVVCAVAAPLALGGAVLGVLLRRPFGWLVTLPAVAVLVVAIAGFASIGPREVAAGIRVGAALALAAGMGAAFASLGRERAPH